MMKAALLEAVRAASKREREHRAVNVRLGVTPPVCCCTDCNIDRMGIAAAMPDLLQYIDDTQRQPRREHFDLGDLD